MEVLSIGNGTVVSHCAGDIFSAAVADDGQLYLWAPAFEDAQEQTTSIPKPFHGFTHTIEMVAIGAENFICALTSSKQIYSWGEGSSGQLGHGDKQYRGEPTLVEALENRETIAVGCGGGHTVSVDSSGAVFSWGAAASGQLGHPERIRRVIPFQVAALADFDVVSVGCGMSHTAALTRDGQVLTWGLCDKGQLGRGPNASPKPAVVPGLQGNAATMGVPYQVECGADHTGVVTDSGFVFTWGNGQDGQLGFDNTDCQYVPAKLSAFGENMVAKGLSCSARYSLVHTEDGSLFIWGTLGEEGQGPVLGPHKVQAARRRQGTAITSVSCSNRHILILSESGILCQWGPTSSISLDAAKVAFSGRMLTGSPVPADDRWERTAVIMRVWHRMESSVLRRQAKAFRKLAQADSLSRVRHAVFQSCARCMLHRGTRAAFNSWKNKHQEENRESEKRINEENLTNISSAHDQAVRKLTEEVSISNSRLKAMKLNHAFQKASVLLRDRVGWSVKRGFDKWGSFTLAKGKEHELRRSKMKLQVTMNNIASERAALEEQAESLRRSRIHLSSIVFFYRWKSCIDRSVRLAEEAKLIHQRDSLITDMKAMYDLMVQSNSIEADAYAASMERGAFLVSTMKKG